MGIEYLKSKGVVLLPRSDVLEPGPLFLLGQAFGYHSDDGATLPGVRSVIKGPDLDDLAPSHERRELFDQHSPDIVTGVPTLIPEHLEEELFPQETGPTQEAHELKLRDTPA